MPNGNKLSRRAFLQISASIAATGMFAACTPTAPAGVAPQTGSSGVQPTPTPTAVPDRLAAEGREIVIEVQYPYGGTSVELMNQIWTAYEEAQPDVGIKAVWAANDLSTNQKLFTAIAAGTPPDVSWVDGPQVAEWAERGALADLTDFFETAGLTEENFWAPSWRQNFYKGKIWAITYTSDANFGFFWNKAVFEDAGLDPETPPTTIDELTQFNTQINRITDGNIERMGIVPWQTYGSANSMFTWGWIFGGEFFEPDTNTITADHERNVMALEWMKQLVDEVGGFEKVGGFQAGFGTGENHPFFVGKTAMALFGPWELSNIARFAPDLEYGITFAPAGPPPAEPHSSWVGGWCIGIPQGAKQIEPAWDFLNWLCATDEGTILFGRLFSQTPGYKDSAWYDLLPEEKPEMVPFLDILREARHQRPVMPAQAYFMGALQRNVDAALLGEKSPQQALADATEETQNELNRILERGFEG
ncbi:MAG TPA: ABC transporter substrate-binding protein [Caldilineaceae bacterium]|nr:ABC transporter substrate-binding protein [Caldilineaceae bacterium]